MISFYPGPSRVHDAIPKYVKDAARLGIMSINHRSDEFVEISKRTIKLLKEKLKIPENYIILYTTSATECWEVITQSLMDGNSYHLYNGAFGEKWFEYTKRLHQGAEPIPFNREDKLDPKNLEFDKAPGVICITQNETSNGTQVSNSIIRLLKKNHPSHLIAVDATSSMGGIMLDFKAADVWFASVQKCFGLPAGLALMVFSPRAIERSKSMGEKGHYNSLNFMLEMIAKWQTPFTPNVLNIYLLMRIMEKAKPIEEIEKKLINRFKIWSSSINSLQKVKLLIKNKAVQSYTVLPLQANKETIAAIKSIAKENDILLGEGYGDLKQSTFRIANFPAIRKKEINKLMKLLASYDSE